MQQANVQSDQQLRQARLQAGQTRANISASGIQLDGSALEVLEDNARQSTLDNLTIKYNGDMKARGFNNDSGLSLFEGANAKSNSYLVAGGTLLSGLGSAAGKIPGGAPSGPKLTG